MGGATPVYNENNFLEVSLSLGLNFFLDSKFM